MSASSAELDSSTAANRRWALLVLAVPAFLVAMDQNVLLLALPALAEALGATAVEQLWISDVYGLAISVLLIPAGALTDRVGARRMLLAGATAFAVLSVLAAYASSVEMLVVVRALMGAAGATLGPASLAMIAHLYPEPAERARAIGLWMTCFMSGMIIGPVVGGVVLGWFWWGSVFLLGIPAMLLLAVVGPRLLPVTPGSSEARLDLAGAGLSVAALFALVLGLKQAFAGERSSVAIVTLGAGAVVAWLLVRHLRTTDDPLVSPDLLRNHRLVAALAVMCSCAVLIAGTYLFFTQYLQLVADLTPLSAGLVTVIPAVAFAVGAMAGPALVSRCAPHVVLAAGLAVASLGLGVVVAAVSVGDLVLTVAGFSLTYLGFGPGASLGTDLVIGSVSRQEAGTAGALSETSTELGQALGIAVLGSLGALVYRTELSGTTGGSRLVGQLDGFTATDGSHAWAVAAESAFGDAFRLVALAAGVLVMVLAAAAPFVLRPQRLEDGHG